MKYLYAVMLIISLVYILELKAQEARKYEVIYINRFAGYDLMNLPKTLYEIKMNKVENNQY